MTETLATIGRFRIEKQLGEGNQGSVYLALDPRLGRQVAVKTLPAGNGGEISSADVDLLFHEARMVSQFQHPNIVSLYEISLEDDAPFLVLEYVDGLTLDAWLQQNGTPEPESILKIMDQILDALSYAHNRNMVHSDLKPSNIIVQNDLVVKILDFGIARYASPVRDRGLTGTPRYMAPEYIRTRKQDTRADIFALGLIFYEMLTGKPAIGGQTERAIYLNILNQVFVPPSQVSAHIPREMDDVALKALEKKPDNRFPNASTMRQALQAVQEEIFDSSEQGNEAVTVQFLLKRMQRNPDFPALSNRFTHLNQFFASENESANSIAAVILKDLGLTNKLLRVVNSAFYARRGGKINTISRAVVMLGFRAVRDMAASLILFENLRNQAQASALHEQVLSSLYTAVIARQTAEKAGEKESEEMFLSGLFHQLGKLSSIFYLHEENEEIERLESTGIPPEKACREVMGLSYVQLGQFIAKQWNFPQEISASIAPFKPSTVGQTPNKFQKLQAYAGMANEICKAMEDGSLQNENNSLQLIYQHYEKGIQVNENSLEQIVDNASEEFITFAQILNIRTQNSPLHQAFKARIKSEDDQTLHHDDTRVENRTDLTTQSQDDNTLGLQLEPQQETASATAELTLTQGIQDITQTLVQDYNLQDLLQMVLETIHRAINFDHTLICIQDKQTHTMKARFGFGEDIQTVIKQFHFPITYTPDIFHLSLKKGVDVFISDVQEGKTKNNLPDWYKKRIAARSFVIFPLLVKGKPLGIIYADHNRKGSEYHLTETELNLLKTLRNQAVLAIKEKLYS